MIALRPGSLAWFFRHDLRLSTRSFEAQFHGRSRGKIAAILCTVAVAMHLLAWPAARWLAAAGDARLEMWLVAGAAASLPLFVAQAMISAMRTLYARGDLDLLFASPVSAVVVLASRALAIAFEVSATVGMVLLPIANAGALIGKSWWLALYPALLSSALASAGIGLLLAMLFFIMFGPRRARLLSQLAATLLGVSYALTAQAIGILPTWMREALIGSFANLPPGSWLEHRGPLWLPVSAALPLALALWLLFGLSLFVLSVIVCGRRMVQAMATAIHSSSTLKSGARRGVFRGDVGTALRVKERRLITRDPWLLSQMLLQVVYTLPIAIVLLHNGGVTGSVGVAVAPAIVVIAAQLSGSLAWVALSAEDAPDFLASAPVTRGEVERRKIEAIALPIGLLLAAPVLALALASPWAAVCVTLFALGAGVSTTLVNLWRQAPARRSIVLRRHSQSRLTQLIELSITILWAIACAAAIMGSWTTLALLALAALILWLSRPRRRREVRRAGQSPALGASQ
jgi:ABC-2 type transport system permease protein